MDEYKSNSQKARTATESSERRLEPVVNSASTQKKSGFSKFADNIIATSAQDLGSYLFYECLIPWIKKGLHDMFTEGVDVLFYGKSGINKSSTNATKISYGSYYSKPYGSSETTKISSSQESVDYDNIIFDTRGDAEAVLSAMEDIVDQFQIVSVSDLYELSNLPVPSYTMNKYGWTGLKAAQVMRNPYGDGYVLKMPRAKIIR